MHSLSLCGFNHKGGILRYPVFLEEVFAVIPGEQHVFISTFWKSLYKNLEYTAPKYYYNTFIKCFVLVKIHI